MMSFTEYSPSGALADYIDAYWVRKTNHAPADHLHKASGRRVYADGCADIMVNTGTVTAYFNPIARLDQSISLYPGQMYLGGTMTAYGVVSSEAGCALTGIRYRPGGVFALYKMPMEEAVDQVVPFADKELLALMQTEEGLAPRLDAYFFPKIPVPAGEITGRHDFVSIYKKVYVSRGQVSVETLSRDCHVSSRTLERIFKENVGIPPKEFIKIVRFQEVLKRLRAEGAPPDGPGRGTGEALRDGPGRGTGEAPPDGLGEESLLRIAFELGYYDHAHLTNEFKRYAGIRPSELSRFYKTGIGAAQYF